MKKLQKITIALSMALLIISLTLAVVGCGGEEEVATPTPKTQTPTPTQVATATPTPKPIHLKLHTVFTTASPEWPVTYEPFKEEVESKSNGRLIIDLYPGATLVSFTGALDATIDGTVDIAFVAPLYHLAYLPLEEVWCLPPFNRTSLGGTKVYLDLAEQYFNPTYTELGLHRLGTTISPPYWVFTKNKQLYAPEDFKGVTIRGGTALHATLFNSLGANTVSMTSTDTYDALQKGTLDAAACYPETLEAFKWYETGTPGYIIDCGGLPSSSGAHVMNLALYQSLPADLQKILDDAGLKYLTLDWVTFDDDLEGVSLDTMETFGNHIIRWTPYEQQRLKTEYMDQMVVDWINKMEAKGYPAQELVDAIRAKIQLYEQ